jgi:hypothetical protein
MSQKRQHPRFSVRLSAEISRGRKTETAVTRNVSVAGANLVSDHPFQDGETFRIGLFLVVDDVEDSTRPPLECQAKVQWTAELDDGSHSAGVHFEDMTAEQQAWLDRFLKEVELM